MLTEMVTKINNLSDKTTTKPKKKETKKVKRILAKDVCPVFRNQLLDSLEFTKFWFMQDTQDQLAGEDGNFPVPVFRTKIERFLAYEADYLTENTRELSEKEYNSISFFSNGMPDVSDLSDTDVLVIKDILNIKMKIEERVALDIISKKIKSMINSYINNRNFIDSYYRNKKLYPASQEIFKEAAESGWFDQVPGIKIQKVFDEKEFKYDEESDEIEIEEELDKEDGAFIEPDDNRIIELVSNAIDEIAPAGDSKKFIKSIMNDGSRGIFVSSMLDVARGFIKAALATMNIDDIHDSIGKIDIGDVNLAKSSFKNLSSLIAIVIDAIDDIKNADDIDDVFDIIDRAAKDIADLFESDEDFIKDLKRILKKVLKKTVKDSSDFEQATETEVKKDSATAAKKEKDSGKVSTSESKETKKDENPAAFMKEMFPTITAMMGNNNNNDDDDSVPFFCKDGLIPVGQTKKSSEIPSFIADTMMQQPEYQKPAQTLATCQIEHGLVEKFPWVKNICDAAIRNNVSLVVNALYSNNVAMYIQFIGYTNSSFNWLKSFTVDLGYIIDDRYKVFFNVNQSGFGFLEKCDTAYGVFSKEGNLNEELFQEIFSVGVQGIDGKTINKYRLFNSNIMQLNRTIDYRSVSTHLGLKDIKKEDRSAMRVAIRDSLYKMAKTIKDISKQNGIDLGRFYVKEFDAENMHYVLSNIGGYWLDKPNSGPRTEIGVTIVRDKDGKVIRDKDNSPNLNFILNFMDNSFDINQLVWPNYTTTVEVEADSNTAEATTEETDE